MAAAHALLKHSTARIMVGSNGRRNAVLVGIIDEDPTLRDDSEAVAFVVIVVYGKRAT